MLEPHLVAIYAVSLWAVLAAGIAALAYRLVRRRSERFALICGLVIFAAIFLGPGLHAGIQQASEIGIGLPAQP